jgi:hypothetical protein
MMVCVKSVRVWGGLKVVTRTDCIQKKFIFVTDCQNGVNRIRHIWGLLASLPLLLHLRLLQT